MNKKLLEAKMKLFVDIGSTLATLPEDRGERPGAGDRNDE